MNKEIENLIRKSMAKDVVIAMLNKEEEGLIISKEIILEILEDLTKAPQTDLQLAHEMGASPENYE